MKFISRTIISLGLTFLMLAGATAQNVKIGVVDMKRIFAEYGRTKGAESEINDRKAQAKKELDERTAKYKELLEKFQALQAQVQDEALSPQLREQKRDEGAGCAYAQDDPRRNPRTRRGNVQDTELRHGLRQIRCQPQWRSFPPSLS